MNRIKPQRRRNQASEDNPEGTIDNAIEGEKGEVSEENEVGMSSGPLRTEVLKEEIEEEEAQKGKKSHKNVAG